MGGMKSVRPDLAIVAAAVLALAALAPARAQTVAPLATGASLAAEMGCINCHGASPRGDAPSFRSMQQRAASRSGDRGAIATHWIEEMRATASGWRAIVGHRQVSDETARTLAEWLVQPPPAKPVN